MTQNSGETPVDMSVRNCGASYWNVLAGSYGALRPPLVPSLEEIGFMEETTAAWAASHPGIPVQALLLGVTPLIARMRWPKSTVLVAIDGSFAMVRHVWPGNVAGVRGAAQGDWLALPLREHSCHIVIGDGSINCLGLIYPEGFRNLAEAVFRVLDSDGIFLLRCYLQPDVQERPEDVFEATFHPPIPTFNEFKFRLLMAVQQSTREGLVVNEVYRYWASLNVDATELASRTGWDQSAIEMMELYRGAQTVYTFTTRSEILSVLCEFFDVASISTSASYLGRRCPILVLRPRRGPRASHGVPQ